MKKLLGILVAAALLFSGTAFGQTIVWDTYTDTEADTLRIYQSSTKPYNWQELTFGIAKDNVAAEVPAGPDNTRVYYKMNAHDSTNDMESSDSDVVSFYWTTGGGGTVGPAGVGGIRLLDCSTYDSITDDGSPEWDICAGRYNKP